MFRARGEPGPGRQSAKAPGSGFTLMEVLVVMTIISVVLGISAGMLARAGRAGVLDGAARVTRVALQRARALSRTEGILSRVTLTPFNEKTGRRANIAASWSRIAGSWHFDDTGPDLGLGGNQIFARIVGGSPCDGRVRGGVRLVAAGRISAPSILEAPTHDPEHGFTIELDIKPDGAGRVVAFGGGTQSGVSSFAIHVDDDGSLSAFVTTQPEGYVAKLKTSPGVIEMGEWARVGLFYDGVDVALTAHGVIEARVQEVRLVEVPPDGALTIGGFSGIVDEVLYRTASEDEPFELEPGVDFKFTAPLTVRFDGEGRLNERFHRERVTIQLTHEAKTATVTVDLAGVIR